MTPEPMAAETRLPWLDFVIPAGSQFIELRVWEHEAGHNAMGEIAGAVLVELPDGTQAFQIRHVRPRHHEPQRAYGGVGHDEYQDELEVLWLAFNHDATLSTSSWDAAIAALTSLEATGSLGAVPD